MEVKPMLALPEGLDVTGMEMSAEVLTISAVSKQIRPRCPLCGTAALRVHSRYTRTVADLPCSGYQVRLLIGVCRYFCDVLTCARKIFVERLTPFVICALEMGARLHQWLADLQGDQRTGIRRNRAGGVSLPGAASKECAHHSKSGES